MSSGGTREGSLGGGGKPAIVPQLRLAKQIHIGWAEPKLQHAPLSSGPDIVRRVGDAVEKNRGDIHNFGGTFNRSGRHPILAQA